MLPNYSNQILGNIFLFSLVTAILCISISFTASGQCTGCTVNINGNNAPSTSIVSGSVVCISGDRSTTINFNNSSNITICISPNSSWNGSAQSLSSLSVIHNYGSLTVGNSFISGNWTINNYNFFYFNSNLGSGATINNYNILKISENIHINGTLNLAGTLEANGNLHLNGTGRIAALNANQCNAVTVTGTFTSDGVITGNNLDYVGTGSALYVNKMPGGNANHKLTGGAMVGNCATVNCVETISTKASGRTDMVYIYRCSGTFTLQETVDEQELSGVMLLLVAGGGGGGMGESAGGGGAGSMYESNNIELEPGSSYQVIVGIGGIGANNINVQGGDGSPSSFFGLTAPGGGGGGSSSAIESIRNGRNGGSGGGGAANIDHAGLGGAALGTFSTQGGNSLRNNSNVRAGGGGGGASSRGVDSNPPDPGNGGSGRVSSILADLNNIPLPNRFGGGGGGTGRNSSNTPVSPALGGAVNNFIIGGAGNNSASGKGGTGVTNTGSGGGAGVDGGGAGATGVVVLRLSYGALPVEYAYINAVYHDADRKVDLHWATSKEWENSHFEIERSITNVNNWEKVGEVPGVGWSDAVTEYKFEDLALRAQNVHYYYRLRQVDFNQQYEYSKTIRVSVPKLNHSNDWSAYPNPIYEGDIIRLSSKNTLDPENIIQVRLISSQSTISSFLAVNVSEINDRLQHAFKSLPKGLFLVEIAVGDKIEYIKMMKR